MDFIKFVKQYGDEQKCKALFKSYRDKIGVTCKHCGNKRQYWISTMDMYECSECHFQTTLRSGTLLEASKLPYQYWIYAIYLMTMTKKSISALEMQRQLGHKRYEPIWAMLHKIRAAMGNRESKYELKNMVEMDDAFFVSHDKSDKNNKRGRGSSKQSKVLVMTEVRPNKGRPAKGKKYAAFRFVKMFVISDSASQTINSTSEEMISKDSKIKTDGWRGFNKLNEIVKRHIKKIVPPKEASNVLPWVHTMISNAKRNFLGTHHSMNKVYLQNYLNEFCYKTNRRHTDNLFDRLMVASVEDAWYGKLLYSNG